MFKRCSILLRRPGDTRALFAERWERHGTLVRALPLIRAYVQNHVVEECGPGAPIEADGIVELRFDRAEDMAAAFADPAANRVRADEPAFLGHGTGYALANDIPPLMAADGAKLIAIVARPEDATDTQALVRFLGDQPGCIAVARDDVASILARPEMKRGPQPVSAFVHAAFRDVAGASQAGRTLAQWIQERRLAERIAVFRVRTLTVV